MQEFKVNFFWSQIKGHASSIKPQKVESPTLDEAVRLAFASDGLSFAFRRNHELIDIQGRFRTFSFADRRYVAKVTESSRAKCELDNAIEAQRRLSNLTLDQNLRIEVVIPQVVALENNLSVLLSLDFGRTLHETLSQATTLSKETIFSLLKILLNRGIQWQGFVPRNLIYVDDHSYAKLLLIDWEDVSFFEAGQDNAVDSLTFFLWVLNWSQVYGPADRLERELHLWLPGVRAVVDSLDSFEKTYSDLIEEEMAPAHVRQLCSEITLLSEAPFWPAQLSNSTPMELGHLIDDLLPPELSVLYTFTTAKLRRMDETIYAKFVKAGVNVLQLAAAEAGAGEKIAFDLCPIRRAILLTLLAIFNPDKNLIIEKLKRAVTLNEALLVLEKQDTVCASLLEHARLRNVKGWSAATRRAALLERILGDLFSFALGVIELSKAPQMLLRGSLGQGLVSSLSDVDFEISSPLRVRGHRRLESLIGAVLEIFTINWEGSEGRPVEADLVAPSGLTRDLHEWSELRQPGSGYHDPGWLSDHFAVVSRNWWARQSIYERAGRKATGKYLFFEARALIARLAFAHRQKEACTDQQLAKLADYLPPKDLKKLYSIAHNSLAVYEEQCDSQHMLLEGRLEIDEIRSRYFLPGPATTKYKEV